MNRGEDEAGFTLIEVGVSLAIFATIVVGLVASLLSGLQLVGRSSARQNAVQIAAKGVEDLRALPFGQLGHLDTSVPANNASAEDPDNGVSGSNYTVPSPNSVTEPLTTAPTLVIRNSCTSVTTTCILHKESVTTEKVTYTIYRYVTTPPSPAGTKRVSVSVTWKGSERTSTLSRVNTTTVVTSGVLAW